MKLSMEIPIPHLRDLSPLCDIDFALAHLVLEDKEYAAFYREQTKKGREVILDNSFHELGVPLSPIELQQAALRIEPTVIVAPDRLGQPEWNWKQYAAAAKMLPAYPVGICVSGNSPQERNAYTSAALSRGCRWFFWPFKEPRLEWLTELWPLLRRYGVRHHFLGVSSLHEIKDVKLFLQSHDYHIGSYDTGKPIKFGIKCERFTENMPLRGGGYLDLKNPMGLEQMEATLWNIAFLRRFA